MPQAVVMVFAQIGWTSLTAVAIANVIGAILLEVSLGALEFRDEAGDRWIAIDD